MDPIDSEGNNLKIDPSILASRFDFPKIGIWFNDPWFRSLGIFQEAALFLDVPCKAVIPHLSHYTQHFFLKKNSHLNPPHGPIIVVFMYFPTSTTFKSTQDGSVGVLWSGIAALPLNSGYKKSTSTWPRLRRRGGRPCDGNSMHVIEGFQDSILWIFSRFQMLLFAGSIWKKIRVWFYSIYTITIYHHLYRIIPSILNLEVSLDGTLSSQPCVEKLNTGPNHPTTPQFGDLNLHLIHLDSKG